MSKKMNLLVGLVAFCLVVFVGTGAAWADDCANDAPSPFNTVDCAAAELGGANVCEYSGGTIYCTGTSTKDIFKIISSGGDPMAWGRLDQGSTNETFCCDAAEMDDDDHPLDVELGSGNDYLCLHDETRGAWCAYEIGADAWPADLPAGVLGVSGLGCFLRVISLVSWPPG